MKPKQIVIYGGGGFAREVAWLVQSCNQGVSKYQIACFVDDNEALHGSSPNGIPILSLRAAQDQFPEASLVSAIGSPRIRQHVVEKATAAGFTFETIIHPRVERSEWIEIGAGSVVCVGSILTTNIILGQQVQINLDCTIGHDVVMGDYATLAPGVHISGNVHLGQRVYVGTGATIINGTSETPLIIGDDTVIGAGACVTRSMPSGLTVVGVPAKPLQRTA